MGSLFDNFCAVVPGGQVFHGIRGSRGPGVPGDPGVLGDPGVAGDPGVPGASDGLGNPYELWDILNHLYHLG